MYEISCPVVLATTGIYFYNAAFQKNESKKKQTFSVLDRVPAETSLVGCTIPLLSAI